MQTVERRRRAAAGILLTLLLSTIAPVAHAEVSVATKVADRSFPAVSLVSDSYVATVTIPTLNVNQAALDVLFEQIMRQVASGVIPETEGAVGQAVVDAISADPFTYIVDDGDIRTTEATLSTVGTAWSITPDGYAVTAAHVVAKTDDELRQGVLSDAIANFAEEDAAAFAAEGSFTAAQVDQLTKATLQIYAATMELVDVQQRVQVRLSEAGADGKEGSLYPATVVEVGEGFPGADYALLKIDGVVNLPTVPMGDEDAVVTGEQLFVVGFPASSTFFFNASLDSIHQPTITDGAVTALKSTADGLPVFQTQAPASGGNSGGPAFNRAGEAVGVLVAGALDLSTGAPLDGQTWVLSNSVVKDALARHGIQPRESRTTQLYDEALAAYYQDHFSVALPLFEEVRALLPSHAYVGTFIAKCQAGIDAGRDLSPVATTPAAEVVANAADVADTGQEGGVGWWVWALLGLGAAGGVGLITAGALTPSHPRQRR